MNRLVIIGNGFDMAHDLKTSYKDFINWYWDQIRESCEDAHSSVYKDDLVEITLIDKRYENWHHFFWTNYQFRESLPNSPKKWKYTGFDLFSAFEEQEVCTINRSALFERITKSIETKGWVDIENDYYQILKKCIESSNCECTISELNNQLFFIQNKLIEYLKSIKIDTYRADLYDAMTQYFDPKDFSTEGKEKALDSIGLHINDFEEVRYKYDEREKLLPKSMMLLSFNYTATVNMYRVSIITHNYIHGDLEHPQNIIFGYGDELDKDFKDIVERNENELLKNVKSVKYLETDNYRKMLNFIESEPFQVFIMGHSCGNSDRTLLNTIFEHKNCVSIKPFYYKREDGTDNYLELVQNIYRNFTDLKLYRDRVVNKTQCLTM